MLFRSGALRVFVDALRADLVRSMALLEAVIDFADEDVPEDVTEEVLDLLDRAMARIDEQVRGSHFAERVRSGFEVAIVGPPNIGKSTLLNALAGREAAITSEHAGTTRDIIEVHMDLRGIPVTLLDTAGVRETDDPVERIGVTRARARADAADLRVFLVEQGAEPSLVPRTGDLVLVAKQDDAAPGSNGVSGRTGAGIDEMIEALHHRLQSSVQAAGVATQARHRTALTTARERLAIARELVALGSAQYDMAADELRHSVHQLEVLVGHVGVEDLLDVIFASFCLGK